MLHGSSAADDKVIGTCREHGMLPKTPFLCPARQRAAFSLCTLSVFILACWNGPFSLGPSATAAALPSHSLPRLCVEQMAAAAAQPPQADSALLSRLQSYSFVSYGVGLYQGLKSYSPVTTVCLSTISPLGTCSSCTLLSLPLLILALTDSVALVFASKGFTQLCRRNRQTRH